MQLLKKPYLLYLFIIIIIGGFFRFYNLNWDQGHHLHPDERAIIMFALPLHFPQNLSDFFSKESTLNPHFFAYGNFPLYLLKGTATVLSNFDMSLDSYDKINLVGRAISTIADLGTIILIYFIGKKIFGKRVGIIGAFFYAISVFPIQAAHFYAVDSLLTFFILLTLYQLIRFYEKPTLKKSILVGIFFGLSLATKTSAVVLIVAIGMAIAVDFLLIFLKSPHRPHIWFPHIPKFLKRLSIDGAVITTTTVLTFLILEPYALIDFKEFWRQTIEQSQMTRDAFTFPYTLQYVGKIPYFYELKNIFLWGQGPILATISFAGIIYTLFHIIKKQKYKKWAQELILLIFLLSYFAVVGKFAVGWMRYMLPLYPLLALFAAVFLHRLLSFRASSASRGISHNSLSGMRSLHALRLVGMTVTIILIFVWPLSFIHIYTKPNTRVLASQWIYENIPPDKKIALEHWDDGLPIGGNISYKTLELPIYEMQNPIREAEIYQTIQEADYIIITSNRLYAPLQRISKNCQKWNLPSERCSHNANRYYKRLFGAKLGYQKVAEFSVYPTLEIGNWKLEIDDSSADESFTVYDHPKVIIFKKISFYNILF